MADHALPIDAPELEPAGVWPWVVAVLAGAALFVAASERLGAIPESLERQARARVGTVIGAGVDVSVDGRDVTLSGTLEPTADRAALIGTVAAIDGVRVVHDELVVADPRRSARDARLRFREALDAIDLGAVAFEPGSATVAASSERALEALEALLREFPEARVRVSGHTDDTGPAASNLALSRARARAVADRLVARGIDAGRVVAQGYGETQPVASNATAAGRARNRRIEITEID